MTLTKTLRFDDDVLAVLRNMRWEDEGRLGIITGGQMERKLYERLAKALTAMGGKWNRKAGGHLFPFDPRPQVEGLINNGTLQVERDGFFETPLAVVRRMCELVQPTGNVLEPSAGMGAIADHLPILQDRVFCIEKNEQRAQALRDKGYTVHCGDFLEYKLNYSRGLFDTIFMNPPFEDGQDMTHVKHAYSLLRVGGGVLVSVMSEGPFFSNFARAVNFRRWLDVMGAYNEQLPDKSFHDSGTDVATRLVVIRK
jgi:hypothetical protein